MTAQPNQEDLAEGIKSIVMSMRIIVFAMAMGSTMFLLIVAAVIVPPEELTAIPTDPMSWIPVGVGALALVSSLFVPRLVTGVMRKRIATGELALLVPTNSPLADLGSAGLLATSYQSQLTIGCALLEGAAFLCAVFLMVFNGGLPTLLMAGVLIAAILARFPSSTRVAGWILDQLRQIETDRTLAERNPLANG